MKKNKLYRITLTEEQMSLLSRSCELLCRLMCGQGMELSDLFLGAWERLQKDTSHDWTRAMKERALQGDWHDARERAEELAEMVRRLFWGCERGQQFGIHYCDHSDFLWDVYQVLRHQLWLDRPDHSLWTVDASEAMQTSPYGLIKVERIEEQ